MEPAVVFISASVWRVEPAVVERRVDSAVDDSAVLSVYCLALRFSRPVRISLILFTNIPLDARFVVSVCVDISNNERSTCHPITDDLSWP
jgi:hypothetical protein